MSKQSVIQRFIRRHLTEVLAGIAVVLLIAVISAVAGIYLSSRKPKPDLSFDPAAQAPSSGADLPATAGTTGMVPTTETLFSAGSATTADPVLTTTAGSSAADSTPAETTIAESTPSGTTSSSSAVITQETTLSPTPTGPVWYDGYVDPRTVEYEIVSDPDDLTVLINKYYAVSGDYVPELVPAASSSNQKLRPEANAAWDLMRAACYEDTGKTLYLTAGYSTFQQRIDLFEGAIKKVNDNVAGFTMKRVVSKYAYAGRSEHNVGLALDIKEINDSDISSNFLNTTAGAWMTDHAHEYGFILRYPAGKGNITGYDFEAWHFRYVGVDLATALYEGDLTLEEYYGKEQVLP